MRAIGVVLFSVFIFIVGYYFSEEEKYFSTFKKVSLEETEGFKPEKLNHKTYRNIFLADAIQNPENIPLLPQKALNYAKWQHDFLNLVQQLKNDGYKIGNIEEFDAASKQKTAYLRFDVHVGDIVPTFAFFALIEQLQVPATFYPNFSYSPNDIEEQFAYEMMKHFESDYVKFGLHANPTSSVLIFDEFDGNQRAFRNEIRISGQATEAAKSILGSPFDETVSVNGRLIDLPTLRKRGQEYFKKTLVEFQKHFPNSKTVAGHGTPIGALAVRLCREDERYCASKSLFYAPDFLDDNLMEQVGFAQEVTRMADHNEKVDYVGDGAKVGVLQKGIRDAVNKEHSMIILLHPARIQKNTINYKPY